MTNDNNHINDTVRNEVVDSNFLEVIVQQIRSQDIYNTYRNWSDGLILKPYIVSKKKKREISVEGEVDPLTIGRIITFYRAVAAERKRRKATNEERRGKGKEKGTRGRTK